VPNSLDFDLMKPNSELPTLAEILQIICQMAYFTLYLEIGNMLQRPPAFVQGNQAKAIRNLSIVFLVSVSALLQLGPLSLGWFHFLYLFPVFLILVRTGSLVLWGSLMTFIMNFFKWASTFLLSWIGAWFFLGLILESLVIWLEFFKYQILSTNFLFLWIWGGPFTFDFEWLVREFSITGIFIKTWKKSILSYRIIYGAVALLLVFWSTFVEPKRIYYSKF